MQSYGALFSRFRFRVERRTYIYMTCVCGYFAQWSYNDMALKCLEIMHSSNFISIWWICNAHTYTTYLRATYIFNEWDSIFVYLSGIWMKTWKFNRTRKWQGKNIVYILYFLFSCQANAGVWVTAIHYFYKTPTSVWMFMGLWCRISILLDMYMQRWI